MNGVVPLVVQLLMTIVFVQFVITVPLVVQLLMTIVFVQFVIIVV